MCQSSPNVLAYTAVAFFSAMSQQEDAAPHMSHTMAVIVVVWSMLLPSGHRHWLRGVGMKQDESRLHSLCIDSLDEA